MCGIIGYAGARSARPILLRGLERLEYRGYDSAGLALVEGAELSLVRTLGNPARLRPGARGATIARSGIGHTRWATHGRPSVENAHPFVSCDTRLAIVLN